MKKPLTFKQAGLIVIALHVVVIVAFTQYASYKAKIAKELREVKKVALLSEKHIQQDWNKSHIKPKVVATPVPKTTAQTTNTSNKIAGVQQVVENTAKHTSDKIKQGIEYVKGISTTQQLISKAPSSPKSTIWKVEANKQKPTKVIATSRKTNPPKPQINVASIKQNINEIKSEIQTIKTVSFNNGIITQSTEEIQQRMSSHIVLR